MLPGVIMPDQNYPRAQARWESTVPHREDRGPGVAVIPSNRRFDRAPETRGAEAKLIANLITHMQQPDASLGHLSSPDGLRPPQFRDIAVLVRTRTGADLYTSALDRAGIPYHFDSGQGFYQKPEIRAVAHLLQALDDPTDEVAALATLKSPLVAASDTELLELRSALGTQPIRLSADSLPDAYQGRLREAIPPLGELCDHLHRFGLPELIDHVIRASGLLLTQAVGVQPGEMRQRQANLRMLVQRAAHFADNHEDSLRPFVRWLSQRGVRNLPESESPTTEADDDAVRFLTIHQAKGLEFPIVMVPKLQDQPASGNQFIVDRPNQRLEFKLGDDHTSFRTPGYPVAERRDRAYSDAEARRMLYVAATRARDWLILPSFPADSISRRDSFHTYLDDAAPHWLIRDADPNTFVLTPQTFDAAPAPTPTLHTPPHQDLRRRWQERHQETVNGGTRTIETVTPSSLNPHMPDESADVGVDQSERDDTSIHPLHFGQAVHEALEAANFDNLEVTRHRTVRICHTLHVPPDRVIEHLERAMASELIRRASRSESVHRELPLAIIKSGEDKTIITEGVADLVFSEADHFILVDYKSDEDIPPDRLNTYNLQIQQYAAMLSAAGAVVAEAYILRTATGEILPVPLEETSGA